MDWTIDLYSMKPPFGMDVRSEGTFRGKLYEQSYVSLETSPLLQKETHATNRLERILGILVIVIWMFTIGFVVADFVTSKVMLIVVCNEWLVGLLFYQCTLDYFRKRIQLFHFVVFYTLFSRYFFSSVRITKKGTLAFIIFKYPVNTTVCFFNCRNLHDNISRTSRIHIQL